MGSDMEIFILLLTYITTILRDLKITDSNFKKSGNPWKCDIGYNIDLKT